MNQKVDFAGINVDNVSLDEACNKILSWLSSGQPHFVTTPNPEIIVTSQTDLELKTIINQSDLAVPDGVSMIVVSKILGRPLIERVSGIDLMLAVLAKIASSGKKAFLLGSAPGIADAAANHLKALFPGLIITGTQDGYFSDDSEVIRKVIATRPDILFVGLGAGRQERWVAKHLKALNAPVSMVIGGSLDVISGRKKRAPRWTQLLYIEWLYRLVTEPSRWQRQLALPKFLWLMLRPRYNNIRG